MLNKAMLCGHLLCIYYLFSDILKNTNTNFLPFKVLILKEYGKLLNSISEDNLADNFVENIF